MIVALALLPYTETSRVWFKNMQLNKRDREREKSVVTLLLKILLRIRIYNLRDNPPWICLYEANIPEQVEQPI